jgi:hypothetical protein
MERINHGKFIGANGKYRIKTEKNTHQMKYLFNLIKS